MCSSNPFAKHFYQWTRTPSKMSRSLFDTSFPPPSQITKTTLISSSRLRPLPSRTRPYRSILKLRSIERSPSLSLWTLVLGAVVSRGQQAKCVHSFYVSLMSLTADPSFFAAFSIIDSVVAANILYNVRRLYVGLSELHCSPWIRS